MAFNQIFKSFYIGKAISIALCIDIVLRVSTMIWSGRGEGKNQGSTVHARTEQ